jgi:hypothetical protein
LLLAIIYVGAYVSVRHSKGKKVKIHITYKTYFIWVVFCCIDGALTKENYLQSISSAGFKNVNVLEERSYIEPDAADGRKISSLVIKAVRD